MAVAQRGCYVSALIAVACGGCYVSALVAGAQGGCYMSVLVAGAHRGAETMGFWPLMCPFNTGYFAPFVRDARELPMVAKPFLP